AFGAYARWAPPAAAGAARGARRPSRGSSAGRVADALLLAALVKLTALFAALGLVAHLLLGGRTRDALALAWRFAALLLVATLAGWALWGQAFLVQVWLFGFFRSAQGLRAGDALAQLLGWADPVTMLGLAALLVVGLPNLRRAAG